MKKIIIEEKSKFSIVNILITLIISGVLYFLFLPALNFQSISFWIYLVAVIIIGTLSKVICSKTEKEAIKNLEGTGIGVIIGLGVILLIVIINLIFSPLFMSKTYSNRIDIDKNGEFTKDIPKVDFDKLPLLDKDSSQKLGDRVMGQMPELVSQFYVSNLYTQINYNDKIVRVTPLEYNGIFKYFSNHKEGIKGYITVDSVTGKSQLVKLKEGMKYMPSAILMENLKRKLRFTYPTKIFGKISFELDNEGKPYWVVPVMKYKGIQLLEDVEGTITLDPVTGKTKYYDVKKIPEWVDHVYRAGLLIEQIDDWGTYNSGLLNSIFGQKNVVKTTEGYNYTVMDNDVYLYTGITSVASDESNIGFVLSNMRTKETKFYAVPGAEEYSAMVSAKGQVQQMKYTSTFPLLINLNNKPTYLISLKDNGGLVKMYAFVDVEDYQKVVVTESSKGIKTAAQNYLGEIELDSSNLESTKKDIKIAYIANAIINNNTYYYIKDTEGNKYQASIKIDKLTLPFLTVGSNINIIYKESDNVSVISKINLK